MPRVDNCAYFARHVTSFTDAQFFVLPNLNTLCVSICEIGKIQKKSETHTTCEQLISFEYVLVSLEVTCMYTHYMYTHIAFLFAENFNESIHVKEKFLYS